MPSDGRTTVLAVDDIEGVLLMYKRSLEDASEVRTATSGEEALDVIDESVDVVLLDRRMPGLSGDEVAEAIEDLDVDVVVALASAVPPEVEILDVPCDAYLEKPTVGDDLVRWVDRLTRRLSYPSEAREFAAIISKLEAIRKDRDGRLPRGNETVDQAQTRVAELAADLMQETEAPNPKELEPDLDTDVLELP